MTTARTLKVALCGSVLALASLPLGASGTAWASSSGANAAQNSQDPPGHLSVQSGGTFAQPLTSGWSCSINTCLKVYGTKLYVQAASVQGISYSECWTGVAGHLYDGDNLYSSYTNTSTGCGSSPPVFSATWAIDNYYPNGDIFCTRYIGVGAPAGNPCIVVHD